MLYPGTEKANTNNKLDNLDEKDIEIYETRYSEGYDIYDPQYYKWLRATHPTYAEEWYNNIVSSSQDIATLSTDLEPAHGLEQSVIVDPSASSIEVELAGEGNKDLEKYTRRYEEGYNIFDAQYYAWLQHAHPSYAKTWYQTAVKTGSTPSTELKSSDMPGPSALSSTDPSNEMEHHGKEKNIHFDDGEIIYMHAHI